MVWYCCVPNCTSGNPRHPTDKRIAMFSLPKEEKIQKKWLKMISRESTFQPTQSTRVCALHFRERDFQKSRSDTNVTRQTNQSDTPVRKRLRPWGFPNQLSQSAGLPQFCRGERARDRFTSKFKKRTFHPAIQQRPGGGSNQ